MNHPVDGSEKWAKVKVNDEVYVLKESISDPSSSSESEESSSDSSSDDSDDSSESDSSSSSNSDAELQSSKLDTTDASMAQATRDRNGHDGRTGAASQPVKALSPEYVPLRSKGSSSTTNAASGRQRSDSIGKETPERWRMRLWPSKAIISFCRIITRCKPPACTPGVRIGASNGSGYRNEKVELQAHWRKTELAQVPTVFTDPADHSSVFFLLAVEECREAVTKTEDPDSFVFESASRLNKVGQHDRSGRNGWLDGEITAIIAESPTGSLPKACDPRLGSVWVVAAAIASTAPIPAHSEKPGAPPKHRSGMVGKDGLDLSGGDLMVLHSPEWSHPLLGIIQPWDPDYDIKYGINFSVNQLTYISTQQTPSRDGTAAACVQVVNILVCVDQGDGLTQEDIGGWAPQGSVRTGVRFSMAPIGNVMTYIRECQALMSLKLINRSLQHMVLTGSFPGGSMGAAKVEKALASPQKVLSPRRVLTDQPVQCPENVPMPLWLALSRQYNESQLRAICMVSRRYQDKHYPGSAAGAGKGASSTSGAESSLSLLQGPPGTGKTRTILGIVSVFLAGALNLTAQGTTRIIAGASLYGDLAGENATKWSDEKLSRPRGGSVSLSSNSAQSVDGGSIAGKRTRVLICAPSNTAVDEVVYRLVTQGVLDSQGKRMSDLSVVRIGQPCRDEYMKQGIETFGSRRGQGLTASEENMVRVVERATLDTLVEERRRALAASDVRHQGGATFKAADIRKQILDQADVVCSTLSGAGSQPMLEVVLRMTGFKFDAVIIDEAAQAVEPSSLIPFKYNPQAVVLVGDPCQLPATVFSRVAKHANYNQSLFQRLQVAGYPVLMLETQYRMHPLIADYPSQRFYQGRLITGSQVLTGDSHNKPYHNDPSGRFRPFVFHNVPYSQENTEGTSICNREEALYVVDLFEELIRKYPDHRGGIGIIAPYRAQRRLLNTLFRERFVHRKGGNMPNSLPPIWDLDTEISTVDGFQGREKAIVIFSCVRAPTQRTARFYKSNHPSEENLPALTEQHVMTGGEGKGPAVIVQSRSMSELSSAGQSEFGGSEPDMPNRSIGFLKEWQRLNVAITRSRYALWIVGHSDVLRADSEWRHLVEYSQNKGCFYTAPTPARLSSNGVSVSGSGVRGGSPSIFVPRPAGNNSSKQSDTGFEDQDDSARAALHTGGRRLNQNKRNRANKRHWDNNKAGPQDSRERSGDSRPHPSQHQQQHQHADKKVKAEPTYGGGPVGGGMTARAPAAPFSAPAAGNMSPAVPINTAATPRPPSALAAAVARATPIAQPVFAPAYNGPFSYPPAVAIKQEPGLLGLAGRPPLPPPR